MNALMSSRAGPSTWLTTPAGKPASCRHATICMAASGAWIDGRATMVHPAAVAAAILRAGSSRGKFQAVAAAHTPTG